MKVIYRNALIFIVICIAPITCFACTKTFSGDEFLLRSHNKGVGPDSTCYTTDLPKNSFYAFPTKKCVVTFDASNWLRKGWTFNDIEGKGRFTANTDNGLIKTNGVRLD